MGGTILKLAIGLAAASALSAAELPTHVPTYQGTKPAPKEVPKNVPTYRVHPGSPTVSPRLVRPVMNAPRPGVAIPGAVPRQLSQNKSAEKASTPPPSTPAAPNSPNPKK